MDQFRHTFVYKKSLEEKKKPELMIKPEFHYLDKCRRRGPSQTCIHFTHMCAPSEVWLSNCVHKGKMSLLQRKEKGDKGEGGG